MRALVHFLANGSEQWIAPKGTKMSERIAILGHSAVTCLGRDIESTWARLIAGLSGLRRQPQLERGYHLQVIAGMVGELGPGTSNADPAVALLEARSIHLAMAAARAAWSDARLGEAGVDPLRVAVVIGTGIGGLDVLEDERTRSAGRIGLRTDPYLIPGLILNQAAGQIAQHLRLHGPSVTPSNACASGAHAIALGGILLRAGEADFALCGASESVFTPLVVNGFVTIKAMFSAGSGDRSNLDPSQASRPFSADRAGFVIAEGAGMIVLATESAARRLALPIQAELAGWAMNSDGYHMTLPFADRIVQCLESSLRQAGIRPEAVDYYNAHGTSTRVNDQVETQVVKRVFGAHSRHIPVSSIKGALGHSLGAASAIEAAVCVRALREQMIPPTINLIPDPELDLDYVPGQGRPSALETIVSASFGFGGTNNALVLRRWGHAA